MIAYLKLTGIIILSFVLFFTGLFFNPLFNESYTTYALILGLSVAGFIFGWILFLAYGIRKDLLVGNYIKILGSLLGLGILFGSGYVLGSPESSFNATFGFFFTFAVWMIVDPFWELHYYAGTVKSKDIPIFSMAFNVCIVGLMVVSIVYLIDRISFANYGSIRPVKEASKEFRTLDELAASCKEKDKNLVLEIVGYKDGTAQARCEMQLFAETWDVTKLLKNEEHKKDAIIVQSTEDINAPLFRSKAEVHFLDKNGNEYYGIGYGDLATSKAIIYVNQKLNKDSNKTESVDYFASLTNKDEIGILGHVVDKNGNMFVELKKEEAQDVLLFQVPRNASWATDNKSMFEIELSEDFKVSQKEVRIFAFQNNGCAYVFATFAEKDRLSFKGGNKICNGTETLTLANLSKVLIYGEDGKEGVRGEFVKDGSDVELLLKKGRKLTIFDETAISTK